MSASLSAAEHLWRDAIVECMEIACQYAVAAEINSGLGDAAAFEHSVRNFIAAARTASSIFKENRPACKAEAP